MATARLGRTSLGGKPDFFLFYCKKTKLARSHRQGKLGQAVRRGAGPETKDSGGVSAGAGLGYLERSTWRALGARYDQTPFHVLCLH